MPVLHAYRSKEGHYALAGVKGKIVTYRLSVEGVQRLNESGIADDANFPWALLLELMRSGDAYTGSSGRSDEDLSGWTQPGFVFDIPHHEPTLTDPVPYCFCGSLEGLHLVEIIKDKAASILCEGCRMKRLSETNASVPLYLINTTVALDRVLERNQLAADQSIEAFRDLLNFKLAAKWEARAKARKDAKRPVAQIPLFVDPEKEKSQHQLF